MSATTETRSGGNPTPAQSRALERTPRQAFWHGLVQSLPFMLVLVPFGMLFGVVAAEAGLSLVHVLGFSTLVLAGASQFTAVQLMTDQAPVLVVIITAIAVNLRMAMYSASMVPWLGPASPGQKRLIAYLLIDQTYALSLQHYEKHPRLSISQVLRERPARQGLGSVIGYLSIGTRHGKVMTDQLETVEWTGGDGVVRRARVPLIWFLKERRDELV